MLFQHITCCANHLCSYHHSYKYILHFFYMVTTSQQVVHQLLHPFFKRDSVSFLRIAFFSLASSTNFFWSSMCLSILSPCFSRNAWNQRSGFSLLFLSLHLARFRDCTTSSSDELLGMGSWVGKGTCRLDPWMGRASNGLVSWMAKESDRLCSWAGIGKSGSCVVSGGLGSCVCIIFLRFAEGRIGNFSVNKPQDNKNWTPVKIWGVTMDLYYS